MEFLAKLMTPQILELGTRHGCFTHMPNQESSQSISEA